MVIKQYFSLLLIMMMLFSCRENEQLANLDYNNKQECEAKVYAEFLNQEQKILFYPEKDTVDFILDISDFDSVFVAVNCLDIYDKQCWNNYKGEAIQLLDRSKTPNGWADGPFSRNISKGALKWFSIDEKAKRNQLAKLNVIRFQIYKDSLIYERVYHIGVGVKKPTNAIALVDYERLDDMIGSEGNYGPGAGYTGYSSVFNKKVAVENNYQVRNTKDPDYKTSGMTRCFIEKPAVFSLYDQDINAIIQQHIGITISAGGSANYPLKGLQATARKEYGKKKMDATFFGKQESFKNIRLRMGGTGQMAKPCNQLMDVVGHDLYGERGMRNESISLFINGYQWGIGYLQEKFDEHYIEKHYGFDSKYIDVVKIIGSSNQGVLCVDTIRTKKLASQNKLDTLGFHEFISFDENYCWLAAVKDGNGKAFSTFYKQVMSGDLSHLDLISLFDYIIHVDFLMIEDMGRNNTLFWCSDRRNPTWYVQGIDFDYFLIDDPNKSHWNIILKPEDKDPFREILRKAFENNEIRTQFLTRYFDLLNTRYHPKNMLPKIEERLIEFSKEVRNHQYAWEPNSLNANEWTANCFENRFFEPFLVQRHNSAKGILVQNFMQGRFSPQDLHTIEIDYPDELNLGDDFYIQLNTLELKKDFIGEYLPFPEMRIQIHNLPNEYKLIGWEGIESSKTASFILDKSLKLKPIILKK